MTIFTEAKDVPRLLADRLLRVAAAYFPGVQLSHEYVWEKLLAEETLLEQRTRTLFGVREVYPTGALDSEVAALAATVAALDPPGAVLEEPGYDYDPRFFNGDAWGLIELRHKPLVAVHSIIFAYPTVDQQLFTIPADWIRPEKKYGRVNLVPGTDTAINLPANAYILSALGGGRVIPFMIQARYRAGMPTIMQDRPDIVDCIRKMAVISILDDMYLPQSGSTSIDGLSQSLSIDTGKYRDIVDKRIEQISSSLSGVRGMVF